jgi:hypothetical protein
VWRFPPVLSGTVDALLVALGQDVEIVVTPRRENQKTAQLRVA